MDSLLGDRKVTTYRFTQLTDIGEGDRYNEKTKKHKRQYLGKECKIVSDVEPYGMKFRDGAVWSLYPEQFIEVKESNTKPWKGVKYEQVLCIEDGTIYDSPLEAGLDVGKSAQSIRWAIQWSAELNGKHYKYL